MSLTKETFADKIEVVESDENTVVQVRTVTRIVENGEVISSSYHRHVISADSDYSQEPAKVQAVCQAVFN